MRWGCAIGGVILVCQCGTDPKDPSDAGAGGDLFDAADAEDTADAEETADAELDAKVCNLDRLDTGWVPACMGCPGERPGSNCVLPVPDGGIYGRCREDGEEISGKVVGAYCCNHADAGGYIGHIISSQVATDAGGCVQYVPVDILICSVCGDRICATWENRCNCPADCP